MFDFCSVTKFQRGGKEQRSVFFSTVPRTLVSLLVILAFLSTLVSCGSGGGGGGAITTSTSGSTDTGTISGQAKIPSDVQVSSRTLLDKIVDFIFPPAVAQTSEDAFPGATVSYQYYDDDGTLKDGNSSATTDAQGNFTLQGCPIGKRIILIAQKSAGGKKFKLKGTGYIPKGSSSSTINCDFSGLLEATAFQQVVNGGQHPSLVDMEKIKSTIASIIGNQNLDHVKIVTDDNAAVIVVIIVVLNPPPSTTQPTTGLDTPTSPAPTPTPIPTTTEPPPPPPNPAPGEIPFTENFDSYTQGTFPSSGGWALVYSGAGASSQIVTGSPLPVSAPNCLKLLGKTNWSAAAKRGLAASAHSILALEFSMQVLQVGANDQQGTVWLSQYADPWNGSHWGHIEFGGGKIRTGAAILDVYQTGQWYKIKIITRKGTGKYDVYVNDVKKGTGLPCSASGWPDCVTLQSGNPGDTTTLFDDIKVYLVSSGGESAYVPNNESGTVSVIRTSDHTVVKTVTVGSKPYKQAVSPDGQHVYVTNYLSNSVSVIRTSDNTVVATVPVQNGPHYPAITSDGGKVYVPNLNSNTVSVIQTSNNTVVANVSVGTAPAYVSITPDGTFAYITNTLSNNVSVIKTSDNTLATPTPIPVGAFPHPPSMTPDGAYLYVPNRDSSNVTVIKTSDNSVVKTISVGGTPYLAVTPNGSHVYVSNRSSNSVSVIRTIDNALIKTISVGSLPNIPAVTPDSAYVYVSNFNSNSVSVIRTSDNTVTATVSVGSKPLTATISPDGKYVYVPNESSNNISVIRTSDNTVVATVAVGTAPNLVIFKP